MSAMAARVTIHARSNSISQRVMRPLEVDVFTAAVERIRHVYETYDQVVISYSGGKDFTCVLEQTVQPMCDMAHKMGRRALSARDTSE